MSALIVWQYASFHPGPFAPFSRSAPRCWGSCSGAAAALRAASRRASRRRARSACVRRATHSRGARRHESAMEKGNATLPRRHGLIAKGRRFICTTLSLRLIGFAIWQRCRLWCRLLGPLLTLKHLAIRRNFCMQRPYRSSITNPISIADSLPAHLPARRGRGRRLEDTDDGTPAPPVRLLPVSFVKVKTDGQQAPKDADLSAHQGDRDTPCVERCSR